MLIWGLCYCVRLVLYFGCLLWIVLKRGMCGLICNCDVVWGDLVMVDVMVYGVGIFGFLVVWFCVKCGVRV